MATDIDTVVDSVNVQRGRKVALAAARSAYDAEEFGAECKVRHDSVVYVVGRDGVHRLTKSPDGRTISDRIV
jgi:hypothetical protein